MTRAEVEAMLSETIAGALSPAARLPEGTTPAAWTAARFAEWWQKGVGDALAVAEQSAASVRDQLMRLGGGSALGEALEEVVRLQDSLDELRAVIDDRHA